MESKIDFKTFSVTPLTVAVAQGETKENGSSAGCYRR